MAEYPKSREDIVAGITGQAEAIKRGRKLRDAGFGYHWHQFWGSSVSIPAGEQFSDTRLNVRYGMADSKKVLEDAKEYLVLCEEFLVHTSEATRGFRLAA